MDRLVTGMANRQRFTSSLFHDVCPARHVPLFVFVQISHLVDMVDLAFSHQVTEFASVGAESLRDLFALGLIKGGSSIYQNGLFLPFQWNSAKAGDQRLFSPDNRESAARALDQVTGSGASPYCVASFRPTDAFNGKLTLCRRFVDAAPRVDDHSVPGA